MKKVYGKRLAKVLSLMLVFILIVGFLQRYYLNDVGNNTTRLRGFYKEDKNSVDVILLGASEVYSDFSSCRFYKKTGITSYPYAYESNPVTLWKYELREILSRQKPKMLIVEMNGVVYGEKMLHKESSVRYLANNMHLLRDKLELIRLYGKDDFLSYFFPIIKYHVNWVQLIHLENLLSLLRMDLRGYSLLKGSFSHVVPVDYKETQSLSYNPSDQRELNPLAEKYLREFLNECKHSGIEHILFVRFPHMIRSKRQIRTLKRYNRAAGIIEEYGYDYVNLDEHCEKAGIDRPGDFHNSDHLMLEGQIKFTDYLADYLVRQYSLRPTHLTRKQKAEWEKCVKYMDAANEFFKDYIETQHDGADRIIFEKEDILKILEKYL